MLDLTYPAILDLFSEHRALRRTESASFLIWFLENYYRLGTLEAADAVCDQKGDKGVDGIYINENSGKMVIFQCRLSQRSDRTIGDTALKEFRGTLTQFGSKDTIANLMESSGKTDLANLIDRLSLIDIIEDYEILGIFLSNLDLDANGEAYLNGNFDYSRKPLL